MSDYFDDYDLVGRLPERSYPKQDVIPPEFEEVRIEDMLDGKEAYVVYWAIFADERGYVWINGKYTFGDKMGTQATQIKRDGNYILVKRDTFNGKLSAERSTWSQGSKLPVMFVEKF